MQKAIVAIDPIVRSYTFESRREKGKYLPGVMSGDDALCLFYNVPPQVYARVESILSELSFLREDKIQKNHLPASLS